MLKGPLDSFSAFPFENFLGRLKVLLRGTRRPLAQLKKDCLKLIILIPSLRLMLTNITMAHTHFILKQIKQIR